MRSSLDVAGFAVVFAEDVETAQNRCEELGTARIEAVLCDYRLPDETGIAFLKWLRARDENVATVVITGQGEKSVIQQAMGAGAFEYLEKPVTHQVLSKVLEKACEQTRRQRKYAEDRRELEELETLDKSLNLSLPASLRDRLRVLYRPLHETGGDFIMSMERDGGRVLLIVGDVSGHDIRSGYVSTYFQGMFRGCIESGASVEDALQLVNASLRRDSGPAAEGAVRVSLSVVVTEFQQSPASVRQWNYGFTPSQLLFPDGSVRECFYGQPPLGWVDPIRTEPEILKVEQALSLVLYTDGLVEFAGNLDVNSFCLFHRAMVKGNGFTGLPSAPSDDILICQLMVTTSPQQSAVFRPILSEHYAGTEVDHIDHLQSTWRRSINFSLNNLLGDRLYDLLICIREGMLNAFIHGCERSQDKFAHLQISVNGSESLIRVRIDDPGRGHDFDLGKRLEELSGEKGKHLGLGIIHHLSDDFQIENEGTTLMFDFMIDPEEEGGS
ncbi:MAG: SpoIIE family protein phosphatase [Verrucomicrobia bacterium]|nr:SpoIIE family protein phosphatase [Verrucomicrobiota bacterium]